MGVGGPVIVVNVTMNGVRSSTSEGGLKGHMLVEELMEKLKVVGWFTLFRWDRGKCCESRVDS